MALGGKKVEKQEGEKKGDGLVIGYQFPLPLDCFSVLLKCFFSGTFIVISLSFRGALVYETCHEVQIK